MPECRVCGEAKEQELFSKDKSMTSGYRNICKACSVKQQQKYYAKNRDRLRANEKARRLKLRQEVLEHYGHKCECCGENRWEFLCIDHINGGGNKHRRDVAGGGGGTSFYYWIKRKNFPEGLRTLCVNCNHALVHYGECPHGPNEVARIRGATERLSAERALKLLDTRTAGDRIALMSYASALEGESDER